MSSIKLGQNRNFKNTGIDAIADRNIDQTILSGDRHRRFGTKLS